MSVFGTIPGPGKETNAVHPCPEGEIMGPLSVTRVDGAVNPR